MFPALVVVGSSKPDVFNMFLFVPNGGELVSLGPDPLRPSHPASLRTLRRSGGGGGPVRKCLDHHHG